MEIRIENLSFTYAKNSPYEFNALKDISLNINSGEFFGIVGHTGSGKTTLINHLNGLIRLTSGTITIGDIVLTKKKPKAKLLREIRSKVGMVFQYPEYQLFADSVEKDVGFGPKNLGLKKEEIELRVKEAIEAVGLEFEEIRKRSPFELSGGQKRRVAIAGILAMRPQVLVLDEPTSGLDPQGKKEILSLFRRVQQQGNLTIIMISHNIDEVAANCKRIAILQKGQLLEVGTVKEIFYNEVLVKKANLPLPKATEVAKAIGLKQQVVTEDELVKTLLEGGVKK